LVKLAGIFQEDQNVTKKVRSQQFLLLEMKPANARNIQLYAYFLKKKEDEENNNNNNRNKYKVNN
jgi:hypothetical protein